ncbi:lysophospholipid acyltransferase family protein [Granulicella rosea]|uniref:lysophospholipid acyltransferase family protein n=1 Tax=Granulicella rosea TaxID=474952 RepID=UPI00159513E7|nr:lysophospholipid acyltransferase family protein [Granulicella rosea]
MRLAWFIVLLLAAIVDGTLFGPRNRAQGALWCHRWALRIVRGIGVNYTVTGTLPTSGPVVVVSNHLSYLDAILYNAATPFVMVSKSEVRRWPLIGWIAARAGTIFIQRANVAGGRTQTRDEVNAEMDDALRLAPAVLFFPEGTSTGGAEVLPFRRGLFHSVLEHHVPVQAAAIHYTLNEPNPGMTVEDDVCYHGKHDFLTHLYRFLGLRGFHAHLHFGEIIPGADHYAIAENAHAAVAAIYAELQQERAVAHV